MKKTLSKILVSLLTLTLLFGCSSSNVVHVERIDWADDVKKGINDFIDMYGNTSKNYDPNSYVVTDFDNTASIFDMCEQFMIYQAEVMGYGFTPEELPTVLSSGLGDLEKDRSDKGYGKGSYNDWIDDIVTAYTYLYNTYGPFTPSGLNEEDSKKIQEDPMWAEYISKMMNMYFLIGDAESTDVSFPWIAYWYTGMSEDEVYNLAKASHHKYRYVEASKKTISSDSDIVSKVGPTSYTYVEGVQVTENTKEMWKAFYENGIDMWVCTASEVDIIRAAVDEFDLHDYCKGVIGMTPTIKDNKLSYTYDYVTGYAWYAQKDGSWKKGNVASKAQTQGLGKVTAIQNICVKEYGVGPLAGFMDSSGDYNFCTEFKNLKFVICFNRADRTVTDGGGIIGVLAVYQKLELGYDLKKANDNGDTYYVLQGRDENSLRTLRNSNATIKLGDIKETLYRNKSNKIIYDYIVKNKMTTEEVINTFVLLTEDNDLNNNVGFKYGFLSSYSGYHSK